MGYPEFSTPGIAWAASHWMPLPKSPVSTRCGAEETR